MTSLINNRNVAAYVRVSTDELEQKQSIDNQIKLITEYCNEHDLYIKKIYSDEGYTGSDFNRPAFQDMIFDLEAGICNAVITKDLSRFGRSMLGVGKYIDELFVDLKIRYISIVDNYDSAYSLNEDSLVIRYFVNDYYLKETRKKCKDAYKEKAKIKTLSWSGIYGYKMLDHKIVIDEPAAKVVKSIFNDYINGISCIEIVKKLNEKKIPTPLIYKKQNGYKQFRNVEEEKYTLWNTRKVYEILSNYEYTGAAVNVPKNCAKGQRKIKNDNVVILEDNHEPLISKEMYDSAKNKREQFNRRKQRKKIDSLNKMLICPVCKRIYCVANNNGQLAYRDYNCKKIIKGDIIHKALHNIALDYISKIKLDPNRFMDSILETNKNKIIKELLKSLENKKTNINTSIEQLIDIFVSGDISSDGYNARMEILEEDYKQLEQQENEIKYELFKKENLKKEIDKFILNIFNLKIDSLSNVELIKLIIDKVVLTKIDDKLIINEINYKF